MRHAVTARGETVLQWELNQTRDARLLLPGDSERFDRLARALLAVADDALPAVTEAMDSAGSHSGKVWSGQAGDALRGELQELVRTLEGLSQIVRQAAVVLEGAGRRGLAPARHDAEVAAQVYQSATSLPAGSGWAGVVTAETARAQAGLDQARAHWQAWAEHAAQALNDLASLLPEAPSVWEDPGYTLGQTVRGWRNQAIDLLTLAKIADPIRLLSGPEAYAEDLAGLARAAGAMVEDPEHAVSSALDLPTLSNAPAEWLGGQLPLGLGVVGHVAHDLTTGAQLAYELAIKPVTMTDQVMRVRLLDDTSEAAQYAWLKPSGGESNRTSFGIPQGTQYLRSVATSRLADLLGLHVVPETRLVSTADGPASLQLDAPGEALPVAGYSSLDTQSLAISDYLTGQGDRHPNNHLTMDDGRLAAIDNGVSFPERNEPLMRSDFVAEHFRQPLDPALVQQLAQADRAVITQQLRDLQIPDTAIDGVFERMDEIVQHGAITGHAWPGTIYRANGLNFYPDWDEGMW